MRLPAAIAALVLGACSHAAAPSAGVDEAPPVHVSCAAARSMPLVEQVTLRGVVAPPPDRDAVVASAIAGRVLKVSVHEGDPVTAGAQLATVDDPGLATATAEADAAAGAARASVANAQLQVTRAQRLVDQGIAPRRDLEEAEARLATAEGELRASGARLALAGKTARRARLTSPIAGVVVHVFKQEGELVDGTPATPIVEVADVSRLELRADVSARELVRLSVGARAEILLDALPEVVLHGTLTFVSPAVDPATSLGTVRVVIDDAPPPGVHLPLGISGQVHVDLARPHPAVVVPAAALRRGAGGDEEVVVCADGKARVRAVTIGARRGSDAEITDGVVAGELVVTQHVLGLEDGTALEVDK